MTTMNVPNRFGFRNVAWMTATCTMAAFVMLHLLPSGNVLCAQDVWEYSPYRVKFWMSISPKLSMSSDTQREVERKIVELAEIHFGATWNVSVEQTPDAVFGSVLHRLEELTVDQLLARELILVVGKSELAKQAFAAKNPGSTTESLKTESSKNAPPKGESEKGDRDARSMSLQSIRTIESAIARIEQIAISPLQFSAFQRDVVPYLSESQWKRLQEIVVPFQGTANELQDKLQTGEFTGALIQRMELESFKKVARQIPTRLPWQPESLLKSNDKIYLVSVGKQGESIHVQVKELDAFVRRVSQTVSMEVAHTQELPMAIAKLARDCFTPLVRIEDNDYKTALLRIRGAGLVTSKHHPIMIEPGDVLLPVIRRDDSSGNPTVLQSIPFTFIAVTERVDPISKLYGAIFTANRGSLATAKNRRTQRVGLKVSPQSLRSELMLGMKGVAHEVFRGAEVYLRTPGTDALAMIGRTDWRGIVPLSTIDKPTIQYDPPDESKTPAIANARALLGGSIPPPAYRLREPLRPSTSPKEPQKSEMDPPKEKDASDPTTKPPEAKLAEKRYGEVTLNVPLYLYYIKNGETLLARLPIVTGFQSQEVAVLPDDRRRLEAEAFLKGLQGEVLDLVVRRKILESRIKQKLTANNLDDADRLLNELKRVKSYDKLSEQIEGIQRRALSTDRGPVSATVIARIDKMVEATRQLMQKHLKDSLIPDLEVAIQRAK